MRWRILRKLKIKKEKSKTTRKNLKLSEIAKILRQNRGVKTKKQIDEFLNPSLSYLTVESSNHTGINKPQLDKAIKRVKRAIQKKELIIVYSDYDADGICGAAILWETLYVLGANTLPYVPHRLEEGYGLSIKGVDNILKEMAKKRQTQEFVNPLIITVDHGVTAQKQVAYAKKKGFQVIITDHHTLPKKLPQAEAIVHTTKLSGAGVSYILSSQLLLTIVRKKVTLEHLALAALGTIADLVPLIGPNRVIAKFGLEEFNRTKRVGLEALIKEAGLAEREIGTYEVSFMLAPRINAAGRLTHALDSLRLLCTKNKERAEKLAKLLNQTNQERQEIMKQTTEHARKTLKSLLSPEDSSEKLKEKLLFVSHETYHEGVIGLVAGKLVEEFHRPAVVVAQREKYSKASARSINGFNIVKAIKACSDLLVDCGGHPLAAGFTVETKHLEILKERLCQLVEKDLDEKLLKKELKIDCEIDLADVSGDLYKEIQKFPPFGVGNPEPVFASRKVKVVEARAVGNNGEHLKLTVTNQQAASKNQIPAFDAIAFGMGNLYPQLIRHQTPGTRHQIDIAYTISADSWNGKRRLQLKIKDIKKTILEEDSPRKG